MRAFLYARVSTVDKEQDPGPQIAEMTEYCSRQGWDCVEFVDRIPSGKKRPELERMLREIRSGRGHVILCRHFDRIARTARELVLLAEELIALNVNFISLNQQVDTRTPMGKFSFTVLAAAAELERGMIRERVQLGLKDAKDRLAKGLPTRRGKTRWAGRPRVACDPAIAGTYQAHGWSYRRIAAKLGISEGTVRNVLRVARSPRNKGSEKPD